MFGTEDMAEEAEAENEHAEAAPVEASEEVVAASGSQSRKRKAKPGAKPSAKDDRPRMIEGRWSGKPMWECPLCGETTFDKRVVNIHTCKIPRTA